VAIGEEPMAKRNTEDEVVLNPAPSNDHAEEGGPADTPESHDAAVHQEPVPQETIVGTDVAVAAPPEGTVAAAKDQDHVQRLEQAPPPEAEKDAPALPDGAYDSEAFRAANSGARDAFGQVVCRPGHVFADHGGRYVNIFDLHEVYDVEPGTVVPEGLFLFPVNYLVREDERAARIRG
jgi:hypothetical protein